MTEMRTEEKWQELDELTVHEELVGVALLGSSSSAYEGGVCFTASEEKKLSVLAALPAAPARSKTLSVPISVSAAALGS